MPNDFFTIELKNADKLIRSFQNGDLVAQQLLSKAMQQAVDLTANNAASQPPLSEANQPPAPYYIRGTGTQYANGTNRGESRQSNKQWEKDVELIDSGVIGTVKMSTANVPYAPSIHGLVSQEPWHKRRGWRTVAGIGRDVRKSVNGIFSEAGRRFAKYLRTGKVI